MNHTREQLAAAAETAARWAAAARAGSKPETAETLERLADISRQAAERYATKSAIVREDEKDAAALRAMRFAQCQRVEPRNSVPDAEVLPCPWSKELGLCPGCVWKDFRWRFSGHVYECFTAWACGHKWPPSNPRVEPLFTRSGETHPTAGQIPSDA